MNNCPEKDHTSNGSRSSDVKWVYDFDRVAGIDELKRMIFFINRHRYILISVTQNKKGVYTVFFRRPAP